LSALIIKRIIEFGIDVSHLSNISAGSIKLIVTEKGAGVNTMDCIINENTALCNN
jgi:hypothetical protein